MPSLENSWVSARKFIFCSDLEHLDMAQDLCPVPQSLDDFYPKIRGLVNVMWPKIHHFVSLGQF